MSAFTEYNKFVLDHDADCQMIDITPRQAVILAMAMLELHKQSNHGRVCFILLLQDRSTLNANDLDLLDLMTEDKPYLKWGDSEKHSFVITNEGCKFINDNSVVFHQLIPEII